MQDPHGQVVSICRVDDGQRAEVVVDASAVCPRCAAGKGCGAGLLGAGMRGRTIDASVDAGLEIAVGDTVGLTLRPANLLRAAGIVYGYPLFGVLLGAGGTLLFGGTDAAAAMLALAGIAVGALIARRRLAEPDCMTAFSPSIGEKLAGPPGQN